MQLATWNINSIRARQSRLIAWLTKANPDVVCLQETKVEDSGFPLEPLKQLGYDVALWGQKSYNGVAIASRSPLIDVSRGFGDGEPDDEARLISATIHGVRVVNVYVPNGQELGTDKYVHKLQWFRRLRRYLDRCAIPESGLVLCGDMNVALDDRDVWSAAQWEGKIHCSPEERGALANVIAFGLVDLFRAHHPDGGQYSWWDYRGVSLFKNQGLRIDYIFATAGLAEACTTCAIDREARKGQDASDHAPVVATWQNRTASSD